MITGAVIQAVIYDEWDTAKVVNIEMTPAKNDPTIYGFAYKDEKAVKGDTKEIKKGKLRRGTTKKVVILPSDKELPCTFNDFLSVPKEPCQRRFSQTLRPAKKNLSSFAINTSEVNAIDQSLSHLASLENTLSSQRRRA